MELIVVLAIGAPVALAVWLIVRAVSARNRLEELARRLGELEREIFVLKKDGLPARAAAPIVEKPAPVPPFNLPAPVVPPLIKEISAPPLPVKPIIVPPLAAPLPKPPPATPAINWGLFSI